MSTSLPENRHYYQASPVFHNPDSVYSCNPDPKWYTQAGGLAREKKQSVSVDALLSIS